MKTWTHLKLTDTQLRFLSQIVNNRQRNRYGPTLDVLERHGLIEKGDGPRDHKATAEGRLMLLVARDEGW